MRFDPLRGVFASLLIAGFGLVWLVAIQFEGDALFRRLGYAVHAATLLAILALVAGIAVGGLFLRFHHVRMELLEGRRVVAMRDRFEAALPNDAVVFGAAAPRLPTVGKNTLSFQTASLMVSFTDFPLMVAKR